MYFKDGLQEICAENSGEVEVTLKANRIGKQEKYISAISRSGEVDIRVVAEVVLAPELVCARTNITILKTGVYKIPIKLLGYADVN